MTTLLESSFDAWGETTLQGTTLRKDEEDTPGPLTLAVAITRPAAQDGAGADGAAQDEGEAADTGEAGEAVPEPVAVVVGNASFVEGQMLGIQGNQDFLPQRPQLVGGGGNT